MIFLKQKDLWNKRSKPQSRRQALILCRCCPLSVAIKSSCIIQLLTSAFKLTYLAYCFILFFYLLCIDDAAAYPLEIQERVRVYAGNEEIIRVPAGYCAYIFQPILVERFIRKSIGKYWVNL